MKTMIKEGAAFGFFLIVCLLMMIVW